MATGGSSAEPEPLGALDMGPRARGPAAPPPTPRQQFDCLQNKSNRSEGLPEWDIESLGTQGLGPGACAPCGHVFSQKVKEIKHIITTI